MCYLLIIAILPCGTLKIDKADQATTFLSTQSTNTLHFQHNGLLQYMSSAQQNFWHRQHAPFLVISNQSFFIATETVQAAEVRSCV